MEYRTLSYILDDGVDAWGNDIDKSQIERDVHHQIEQMVEEKNSKLNRIMKNINWDESKLLPHEFRYAQDLRGQIHGMELVADSLGLELWEEHQPNV